MKSQVNNNSSTWVQDHCFSAWVKNDPRSSAAMLLGKGDDRFALYDHFVDLKMKESPTLSLEQIDADYAIYTKKMEAVWHAEMKKPPMLTLVRNALGSWVSGHLLPILTIGMAMQWLVKNF